MDTPKTRIGVIGCGNISNTYFNAPQLFDNLEIVACADLDAARAQAQAEKFGVPRVLEPIRLLNDPEVDIVVNLTIPQAHYEISLAALEAGKSVYSEKPLALDREQGSKLVEVAAAQGLRLGCAPDTFLGGGLQTGRKLLDDGWIGDTVAAMAFWGWRGPEEWHPNPQFLFEAGGGPLFDMSPYYLTALVNMLGPVRRVSGAGRITWAERPIMNPAQQDKKIKVSVPTYVAGILEFQAGPIATLVVSYDLVGNSLPPIELYGSQGSLTLPDPNTFGGPVKLLRTGGEWQTMPLSHRFIENSRGLGLSDMASALQTGRPHRASGELALHILDIMQSLQESADSGQRIELTSRVERPAALPVVQPGAKWN